MVAKKETVNCFECPHFYVTWDKHFPRGCKHFNFKTDAMPSMRIQQAIGVPCPAFLKK